MANNKHLTLKDRITIETQLIVGTSFSSIALALDKAPGTISKEVRRHLKVEKTGGFRINFNSCEKRYSCLISKLCSPCYSRRHYRLCRSCGMCNRFCPDFVAVSCPKLAKPPYVCNGCKQRPSCTLEKKFYHSKTAHEEYLFSLKDSRSGLSFCQQELDQFDSIVSPLIKAGQSLHHICLTNRDTLMVSERTLYRLVDSSLLSTRNIDLARKVRFKVRKRKEPLKIDRKCRHGRTYDLFKAFLSDHPDFPIVQIDSVEGVKGGKVLLTIHFVKDEFMLAFLRDRNDARSVKQIFEHLYSVLGKEDFSKLFEVILTDNGSEFSDPSSIELGPDGAKRSSVFYCDPSAPFQKGSLERNHQFIRMFLPKGSSFDELTQSMVNIMMDNINSYARESLSNKSPYDMFSFLYGQNILKKLGCSHIQPSDIVLNRSAFSKEASK